MTGTVIGDTGAANWVLVTYPAGFSWASVQADMEAMLTTGIGYAWRQHLNGPAGGLSSVYGAISGGS
ncbi:MAG TPA: hypothetical protein VG206_02845 [Terriglobia bacterium]|nr:hypothetical protein [Terriglobia bacterium]